MQTLAALTRGNPYKVVSCSRFLPCFAACMSMQLHSRTPQEISQPDPHACNLPMQMHKPKTFSSACSPCPPARSVNTFDHLHRSCTFALLKAAFQERWQLQLSGSDGGKHFRSWWQSSNSCQQHLPWRQQPGFLVLHQEKSLGNIPEYLRYSILQLVRTFDLSSANPSV